MNLRKCLGYRKSVRLFMSWNMSVSSNEIMSMNVIVSGYISFIVNLSEFNYEYECKYKFVCKIEFRYAMHTGKLYLKLENKNQRYKQKQVLRSILAKLRLWPIIVEKGMENPRKQSHIIKALEVLRVQTYTFLNCDST